MSKKVYQGVDGPNGDLANRLFDALGHPVRRRILECLMQGPASTKTLSPLIDVRLTTLAYHLRDVLFSQCGVIEIVEEHQRRGGLERVYALAPDAYIGVIQWPSIPEPLRSGVRGLSLASFLGAAIAALEAESEKATDVNLYASRAVSVDEVGQREIREAMKRLAKKVDAVEDRCAELNSGQLTPLIVATAAFESAPLPKLK